jgi:heterodisulfide reductase subunit C
MATNLPPFLVEVMNTRGGEAVLQCYQCGTCSGSCPVYEEMENGPRRVMYMVQNGMEDEVLSSPDIWYCVSCYSCANRCPRGIEITEVMAALRSLAMAKGYVEDREAQFGEAFAETVERHGRMFEPELMVRYYLRSWDVLGLLSMVPLGMQMLVKGKLPFLPERVREPQEVGRLAAGKETAPAATALSTAKAKGRAGLLPLVLGALAVLAGVGGWLLRSRNGHRNGKEQRS